MPDVNLDSINSLELEKYYDLVITWIMTYTPKILGAIAVLWIWFKIINKARDLVLKIMSKQKLDPMLKSFLTSLMTGLLKVLVIITAAWMLGVQTSSFIAMLAAAGLAVGMALSGTLQNFAGGVMILLFKPFKVGHWVEVAGHAWSITRIEIFNTIMLTGDKKTIIIPNAEVTNSSMVNYSEEPKRRIDLEVWISYTDSIDLAKEVLAEIAKNDEKILQEEEVTIWVKELWDNAVILVFRTFVKSGDYWPTFFRLNETIKKTFDEKGLNFPFPQRDVHMYKEGGLFK